MYSSYSFLTLALDGGEWSASCSPRFTPGKRPLVSIEQEAGWAPEPVSTQRLEEKFSAPVGDRTPDVQSVVRQIMIVREAKIIIYLCSRSVHSDDVGSTDAEPATFSHILPSHLLPDLTYSDSLFWVASIKMI
jgi:hypothetical protein